MKRLPSRGASSSPAIGACLAVLIALAALAGCTGAPEVVEASLSPEEVAAVFEDAQGLVIQGTPAALQAAAARMDREGLPQPRATELAALAGGLYRVLYPEMSPPSVFLPEGTYDGPYRPALTNAGRGEAPPPGWMPPGPASHGAKPESRTDGDEPEEDSARSEGPGGGEESLPSDRAFAAFLERVVPALYLARIEPEASAGVGMAAVRALEPGLEIAREASPRSVVPPFLLGRLFELTGRESSAVGLYQGCLALSDSFYPARQRLASLYLARKKPADAAVELERLRGEFPHDPGIRDSLITAHLASGAPEKASPLVAEALMENPESRDHLYLRAEILLREGNWSQALKPLALLLLNHPEAREGYLLTARVHYEHARDVEAALETIREGEARFPADPGFPELAGSMLLDENRSDEGLGRLGRALELEPGRLSSLRLVAGEAMRLQRWVQAGRTLEQILAQEESPEDLRLAFTVAERLGDRQLALQYAEKLYRLEGDDPARLRYAGALLDAGRPDEARQLAEQGVGTSASPEVRGSMLYLQARLLEEDDPEEALRMLQRALIADPDNDAAVRRLAELYLRRGRLREARLFLRTAVQQNPGDAGLARQLEQVEQELEEGGVGAPPE